MKTYSAQKWIGRAAVALVLTVSTRAVPAADWSLEGALGTSSLSGVYTHLEQPNGKVLVAGDFGVKRYEADGSLDSSFNSGIPNGAGTARALALGGNGDIYVGGSFAWYECDEYFNNNLIKLGSDGSINLSFWPQPNGNVLALAVQANGLIVAGGDFTSCAIYSGVTKRITRLLPDNGYVDSGFHEHNAGFDSTVRVIILQDDGRIIAGGDFFNFDDGNYSGWGAPHVLRLMTNGAIDSSTFSSPGLYGGGVYSLAMGSGSKIFVGGAFTNIHRGIIRFDSGGTNDPLFDPSAGANGTVYAISRDSGDNVYLGGSFTTLVGTGRNGLGKLDTYGVLLSLTVGSGIGGSTPAIYAISRSGDGTYIISGNFTSYNGTTRYGIARLAAP